MFRTQFEQHPSHVMMVVTFFTYFEDTLSVYKTLVANIHDPTSHTK